MAGYWPSSFSFSEPKKLGTKDKEFRFCGNKAANPEQARYVRVANQSTGFASSRPLGKPYNKCSYFEK